MVSILGVNRAENPNPLHTSSKTESAYWNTTLRGNVRTLPGSTNYSANGPRKTQSECESTSDAIGKRIPARAPQRHDAGVKRTANTTVSGPEPTMKLIERRSERTPADFAKPTESDTTPIKLSVVL